MATAPYPIATAKPAVPPVIRQVNVARGGDPSLMGTTVPTPTAPAGTSLNAAAAPPAGPTDYASLFNNALSASNYGIGQQFGLALSDINQREGAANKMLAGLPAAYNTIYGNAQGATNAATGALQNAVNASGVKSFMPVGAYTAPLTGALAADNAMYKSDVPTLQTALAGQFASDRSQIGQAQAQAAADAASRRQSDRIDLLKAGMDNQSSEREAKLSRIHDVHMAMLNNELQNGSSANSNNFGHYDITSQRGQALVKTDPTHAHALRSNPAYVSLVHQLRTWGAQMGSDGKTPRLAAMLQDPKWVDGFLSGNPQYGGTGTKVSPDALSLALFDAGA